MGSARSRHRGGGCCFGDMAAKPRFDALAAAGCVDRWSVFESPRPGAFVVRRAATLDALFTTPVVRRLDYGLSPPPSRRKVCAGCSQTASLVLAFFVIRGTLRERRVFRQNRTTKEGVLCKLAVCCFPKRSRVRAVVVFQTHSLLGGYHHRRPLPPTYVSVDVARCAKGMGRWNGYGFDAYPTNHDPSVLPLFTPNMHKVLLLKSRCVHDAGTYFGPRFAASRVKSQ